MINMTIYLYSNWSGDSRTVTWCALPLIYSLDDMLVVEFGLLGFGISIQTRK